MNQTSNFSFGIVLIVALVSCQRLKPESVQIPEYPDYATLMAEQVELLRNRDVKKEVWLEDKSEVKVLDMDSASWAEELSFLKEINPSQPEYIGAFEKSGDDLSQTLTLSVGEKGALKQTTYSRTENSFSRIKATFHEDKDVYIHHRDIEMSFKEGVLDALQIDGYQKMMFNDTVRFRISLEVN